MSIGNAAKTIFFLSFFLFLPHWGLTLISRALSYPIRFIDKMRGKKQFILLKANDRVAKHLKILTKQKMKSKFKFKYKWDLIHILQVFITF